MSVKSKKTVYIFDLGGVVIARGMWTWREKVNQEYGLSNEETYRVFIEKHYRDFFAGRLSWSEYLRRCFGELGLTVSDSKIEKLRRQLVDCYQPQPEVIEILELLRQRGETLVLLSDQHPAILEDLDEKYHLLEKLDHTIVSAEVGLTKRNPKLFKLAEEAVGKLGDFDRIIFVDDLEHNLVIPRQRGWKTILYQTPQQLRDDLQLG